MTIEKEITGSPWTQREVEVTVATYFQMLRLQELGQRPIKTEYNRKLQQEIPARNLGSIEYKHRNISAVLLELGTQPLNGYRPLPNYQGILFDEVARALAKDSVLDEAALKRVEMPAESPLLESFDDFVVEAPTLKVKGGAGNTPAVPAATKRDYLEREARNRSLGFAGESLIVGFEKSRLKSLGKHDLANKVEHVSQSIGDGLGYDILSYDPDGTKRFIEVKTTAYMAETPFFVSPFEVRFSESNADQFFLYRVFRFREQPQMFVLRGAVTSNCSLQATSYRATLRAVAS